jgi:transcription-repair coupling factor (superfamily II helicase)
VHLHLTYQRIALSLQIRFDECLSQFWKDVLQRYESRRHNIDQPLLAPEELFLMPNLVLERLNQFPEF